jgi:hypothetical protein
MLGSNQVPTFSNRGGGFEVEHREFLFDVLGPATTNWTILQQMNLNPGLQTVFPFASQLAQNFEEVEWLGLVVVYEPSSGSVTTTQGLGTIQIATQYDLQDPNFATQQEMLDYEYATTCVPFQPMIHPVECDPRQNQLARFYVRSGLLTNTTSTYDARYNSYDLGRVTVACSGVPSTTTAVLGKIFLSYKFRLFKPKLYASLGYGILHDSFTGGYSLTGAGIFSTFGAVVANTTNTLGGSLTTAGVYSFPPYLSAGTYRVLIWFIPTSALVDTLNVRYAATTNLTSFGDNSAGSSISTVSATSSMSSYCRYTVSNPGAVWSASGSSSSFLHGTNSSVGIFGLQIVQCETGSE